MALTFAEIELRVRQNVEDINSDVFATAEVQDAINNAKDEVYSLVRIYTDKVPQSNTSVTIPAGSAEASLPAGFLEPVLVESTPTGATQPVRHTIRDFRHKDYYDDCSPQDLYIRYKSDGTLVIGRKDSTAALVLNIYYTADVDDLTSSSFTFGPPPTNNLIIIKATIHLLASRRRSVRDWEKREAKVEAQLQENLKMLDKTDTRYVNYVPDGDL